ncbi:APC family permease [Aeromicrobium sp. 9AM]|uniref:APC family permease n=1 Tax=Aeromicrobium sp. 9AM TaxID=2653126 RepID=UPI0012EF5600|nr:APC family permease [Aeromicrobium sp. 9AM]VXB08861.1 conserved membrane hypothetical protein [Aeromicrobium sp. 9AM]
MTRSSPSTDFSHDLRPNQLSTSNLIYLVLAAAAPLAGVVAAVPLVVSGVGIGAPGMYLAMGVILACFAVGYATMGRHVLRPGAFYAYITLGIGTLPGMASAAIAAVSYVLCYIGTVAITSAFASNIIEDHTGRRISWILLGAILLAFVSLAARRGIQVSARILTVVFSFEILIVLLLDLVILIRQGFGAFSLSSFSPENILDGSPGFAFAFAAVSFVGFEATAIYSRETKDPDRTVPRATYGAVALVATFYVLAAWSLVAANGGEKSGDVAGADPGAFTFDTMDRFIGSGATTVMNLLFLTSYVACAIGTHNNGARYVYSLARDRMLPRMLGKAHPDHASPYVSSDFITGATALILMIGFATSLDPFLVIGVATVGLTGVGILLLQTLVCISAIFYFWSRPERHWAKTIVFPALGAIGMSFGLVLVISNWEFIGRTPSSILNALPWLMVVSAVAAIAYGLHLKRSAPQLYAAFGRSSEPTDPTRARAIN